MLAGVDGSCGQVMIIFTFTNGTDFKVDTWGQLGSKSWIVGRAAQCDWRQRLA